MKDFFGLKDFFGTDLRAGDIIAYPGRYGSSLWVNVAKVLSVNAESAVVLKAQRNYSDEFVGTRRTTLSRTNRAVVLHVVPEELRALFRAAE